MKICNILYLTDNVGLGGGEVSLLNHLMNLDKDRFFPIVVCPDEGDLTSELGRCGIRVEVVRFGVIKRVAKYLIRYPLVSIYKLFNLLRRERIKVVNANGFSCLAIVAPATKMCKVPLVWTCHGWWPACKLTGIFINYSVERIIAVSNYVKAKLINEGYVNGGKIVHLPLGIDLAKYSDAKTGDSIRKEFNLEGGAPIVGMIGRFQSVKGHRSFVMMAAEICKIQREVKFLMVGSEVYNNEEEYKYSQEIRDLIYHIGLGRNIVLTGFRKDVPRLLECMDVLVVPSSVETFGMVVLEAMAAGVPVVSCATGGLREIISDGVSGFIVDKQDPKELAEAVVRILQDGKLRFELAANGRKRVAETYQIRDQVEKVESLYAELMGWTRNEYIDG